MSVAASKAESNNITFHDRRHKSITIYHLDGNWFERRSLLTQCVSCSFRCEYCLPDMQDIIFTSMQGEIATFLPCWTSGEDSTTDYPD